jgi:hypothetical protein
VNQGPPAQGQSSPTDRSTGCHGELAGASSRDGGTVLESQTTVKGLWSHITSLLPLYGRSTGPGRPGMVFFNRAGELLTLDPLNARTKKNAHMLILGLTGWANPRP